jgi:cytochrome c oxidase subunit II
MRARVHRRWARCFAGFQRAVIELNRSCGRGAAGCARALKPAAPEAEARPMHRHRFPLSERAASRARVLPCSIAAVGVLLLGGCAGPQSALEPHGPHAALIAETWWVMLVGGTLIFVIVSALALYAIYRVPERRPALQPRAFVIWAGLVIPSVILFALLVYGTLVGVALLGAPESPPLRIHVTGQQFWWQVDYPGEPNGAAQVSTANEIYFPVGEPIEVVLETRDVIHSLWIPSLAGKTDLIPGKTNSIRFSASRPGVFLGQCAEFCGLLHAHMRLVAVALEPAEFARWRVDRAADADPAVLAEHAPALRHFSATGCADCHAIRGSDAAGEGGPDLTFFGARIDAQQVRTPAGRTQLAVWLTERHAVELNRRHGDVDPPSAEQAEAMAKLLEALR